MNRTWIPGRPAVGWAQAAVALAAGLLLRAFFIHYYPQAIGDTLVYGDLAKNLMQHGIYGMSGTEITPTLIRLPGYPLFLAACFKVFGMEHYGAVMMVQCAADLLGCALAAGLAARLWGRRAGAWTLWLAALCPFTANYVAAPLTETLTLFCIVLALYALQRWHENGAAAMDGWFWTMAAAASYCVLLRPDGGLLPAVVVPAAGWLAWKRRGPEGGQTGSLGHAAVLTAILSAVILLPLAPWTARNWHDFGVFQPLAPRYATDPDELPGYGFNHWYRSWAVDYKSTEDVYWNLNDAPINIEDLPSRAFDYDAQYDETDQVLSDYNDTTTLTQELDDRFEKIAQERIKADPMRYYVELPAARLADMWLRPRTDLLPVSSAWWELEDNPVESGFAMGYGALNLLYVLAAGLGALLACRIASPEKRVVAWAMVAYIVLRSALLFTMDNAEQRYTLEFFPLFFVLAGYALSGAWCGRRNAD